jgi:hypothetical protein
MTTKNFIIKEGRVCCTDKEVPEEPKEVNCGGTHACTCAGLAFESGANRDVVDGYDDNCPHRYTAALQLIKDNAVLIREEDQERAYQEIETRLGYPAKEGVLYPVSVEVEIGDGELCKYCNKSKDGHYHDTVLNRYACKAGDLVAALCTFHPQTVARIVEEPVKLPFKEFKVKAGSIKIEKRTPVVDIQVEEPVEKKPDIKEFLLIPVYADNGEHSHYTLIESSTGIKVWSEDPQECKAQGYPVNSQVEDQEELSKHILNNGGDHDGQPCTYTVCYSDQEEVKDKCLGWCIKL